jgi:hypothetical protein
MHSYDTMSASCSRGECQYPSQWFIAPARLYALKWAYWVQWNDCLWSLVGQLLTRWMPVPRAVVSRARKTLRVEMGILGTWNDCLWSLVGELLTRWMPVQHVCRQVPNAFETFHPTVRAQFNSWTYSVFILIRSLIVQAQVCNISCILRDVKRELEQALTGNWWIPRRHFPLWD